MVVNSCKYVLKEPDKCRYSKGAGPGVLINAHEAFIGLDSTQHSERDSFGNRL